MIDEDTYWRARQASQGRRVAAGRRGKGVAHLLLGLGRCTRCGAAMHLINKGTSSRNGRPFFACSTASRKAGCENGGRWRADHIEARLLRGLAYLDTTAVLRGAQPTVEADRASILAARLDEIETRRARLLALVEDGDESASARYRALGDEAKAFRTELREAEKAVATAAADPGLKARLVDVVDLGRAMDVAEDDERHAIRTRLAEQLRQLVAEVRYDPDLGVLAILTPKPGIPAEQVPKIVGASQMQAWRLWLNDDTDPRGLAGTPMEPDPAEDVDSARSLALFLRGRGASA